LKQGRVPLPLADSLQSLDSNSREQMLGVINAIWNHYKPHFLEERLSLQKLSALREADNNPEARRNLAGFAHLLKKSGIYQKIDNEILTRQEFYRQVSRSEGNLSLLNFFDAALSFYLMKKKLYINLKSR